ncbi:hypothetical protein DFJ74DRAFT_695988 [Hyaloraphidium curvatum]|nr:hypothetical protein DFJ74DRAFT_695988 [Hyaloraphidium curvatum]
MATWGPRELFSDAEWLALFPTSHAPARSARLAAADIGDAPAPASALGRSELLAALRPRLLRGLAQMQLALQPWSGRPGLRALPRLCLDLAMLAPLVVFGRDVFSSSHLTAACVAFAVFSLFGLLIWLIGPVRASFGKAAMSDDLSTHVLAGYVRWVQAVDEGGKMDERGRQSLLFAHDPKDAGCPCPRAGCSGRLGSQAALWRLLELTWRVPSSLYIGSLGTMWTVLLTFSSQTWGTVWSAVLAAIFLVAHTNMALTPLYRFPTNPFLLRLSANLYRRAMTVALDSLISSRAAVLAAAANKTTGSNLQPTTGFAPREAYIDLHSMLVSAWESRVPFQDAAGRVFFSVSLGCVVAAVINASVASCIPLGYVCFLLFFLVAFYQDLFVIAVCNSQVNAIVTCYATAQQDIRELLARWEPPPGANASAERDRLSRHDALLESYKEDLARFRARFLGFQVGFRSLRTITATLLTVILGLWSLLRGSGIYLTVETVCPG